MKVIKSEPAATVLQVRSFRVLRAPLKFARWSSFSTFLPSCPGQLSSDGAELAGWDRSQTYKELLR